ncbi:hypothetical protein RhiLY_11664 [Ceratobasidium sp. AG-Ba]|nr:hypothetical protein RhiLY_11664 [Ceratobasidium sp. AG-Ba]
MSNSHPPFGGYLDSSDHEGDSANTFMQQAPYVPPRVTATSKSNLGSFQLPTSVAASRASVPPTGKPNGLTARNVSVPPHRSVSVHPVSHRLASSGSGASQSRQVTPSSVTGATSRDSTAEPSNALAPRLPSTRPNILLERQVNEMSESFDEYKQAAEQRHNSLNNTLTRILTRIEQLDAIALLSNSSASQTSPIVPSAASAPPENSNQDPFPSPTTELIKIVTRVVSEARLRVGKKKGGADENLAKEHTRQTFYRFVNITSSRAIKPYFKNKFGEPDTLPVQFNDPTTGEYAVFPHWKVPLSKQVAWIPAFIRRFRLSIPNNGSPSSKMLHAITDEGIVTLLNDGVFKTCTAVWRDMAKSDEEIAQMRAEARVYQRAERKAAMRRPYIALVPDLKSPRFDYLSHPGYMSPEESDGEGGLCTKRPDYRARWTNNLYAAIDVAERKKPGFKPGVQSRRTETVRRPIPRLERGTGSQKAIVRVAHCGISKTWRETYPDEFKRYTHLINGQDMIKPNIASFLEQHPEPCPDDNNGGYIKHESGELGGAPGLNPNAGNGQMGVFGSWNGLDYPGDEESGAVLEMNGNWVGASAAEQDETTLANVSGARHLVSIEIDPEVLEDEARQQAAHTANGVTTSPAYVSEMPPPPPLDLTSDDPDDQVALQATHTNSNGKKGKKRAPPEAGEGVGEPVGKGMEEVPPRKRRGRPPGSKNKPKATAGEE